MTDYIFLTDGTFSWNGALSGIVQCWGAGGGGAGNRDIGTIVSGGGGGGGAFAQSIVFASGLTAIVRVGVGRSWWC